MTWYEGWHLYFGVREHRKLLFCFLQYSLLSSIHICMCLNKLSKHQPLLQMWENVSWRQLANKWLCTTQNWMFCVVLVLRLRHVQFSCKKQAIIYFEAVRARARGIWLSLKHSYSRLLYSLELIKYKSTIHHLSRAFFRPGNTSDWKIVWNPKQTNCYTILQYQFAHSIDRFQNNNWFTGNYYEIRIGVN